MASMKIAAFLLLGMVLVASAAEVAQDKTRPAGINAEQMIPQGYNGRFDPMIMHQRRLQTLGLLSGLFARPYYYPQYPQYGYPGGASASAAASSTPYGSSASAAASSGGFGGFNGYNGYYNGGFGRFPFYGYQG